MEKLELVDALYLMPLNGSTYNIYIYIYLCMFICNILLMVLIYILCLE